MKPIQVDKVFDAQSMVLRDLFGKPGEGFYVPIYQREYTWQEENIEQLFTDLCDGVCKLLQDKDKVTFLGTVILALADKQDIPVDKKAIPTAVQLVIDGQQRLATLALLAIKLVSTIKRTLQSISETLPYPRFRERANALQKDLQHVYAVDLQRGEPFLKPKIIRASADKWTLDGSDDNYQDEISHYIATFLRTENEGEAEKSLGSGRVKRNLSAIQDWLNAILEAHIPDTRLYGTLPRSEQLIVPHILEFIWEYEDEEIAQILKNEAARQEQKSRHLALTQLLLITSYLLSRCCITRLEPAREEWGFDMFQSLNSTGTPLTALETFLPIVINAEKEQGNEWEVSPSYQDMERVHRIFEDITTNQAKNTLTNELLLAASLAYSGETLTNRFSDQRRWLVKTFQGVNTPEKKREFVAYLGSIADFYDQAWHMRAPTIPGVIPGLENHDKKDEASILITYLREANSHLSAPILAAYYERVLTGSNQEIEEFVKALRACVAFFTLWRSVYGTSGLDEVYRRFLKGSEKGEVPVNPHHVSAQSGALHAEDLATYFREVLGKRNIDHRESWLSRTERNLTYDNVKVVCKFALFVSTHECIVDSEKPGLMKPGMPGTNEIFTLEKWKAREFRTLEHVAPQNAPQDSSWDPELYTQGYVQSIGNLILLSEDLNKLASNKSWIQKRLYYQHVALKDPKKVEALGKEAESHGIKLNDKIKKTLQNSRFHSHVEPLISRSDNDPWDVSFVKERTCRIGQILWKRIAPWLQLPA